jgi:selenocysteine-specific elongation factor
MEQAAAGVGRAIHPVMAGTAGHIDHGKSSLVRALTGIDPDRLKEEKERGMTIDLGFARLRMADGRMLGLIDVPGHERFVRNMVAGSTGLDLVIFVVAADDGVMPQTREHLDILTLLGVRRGLVALTKIDLVDADTRALASDEVRELLAGTPLEGIEILPVSTVTGAGIPELRQRLEAPALATPPHEAAGPFRLPIQRVFQLKGIGTVVTGVPVSGAVQVGDELEFLPGGARAKVRAVQAFGGTVDRAQAGHSTALSVPDARGQGVRRGTVAASPGIFHAGNSIDVDLTLLPRAARIRHRHAVRFHAGTIEALGSLVLLDREALAPGATALARIELEEPCCVAPGDRFLLRTQTPPITVGGGNVVRLVLEAGRLRRRVLHDELAQLQAAGGNLAERIATEITQAGPNGRSPAELAAALGRSEEDVRGLLPGLGGTWTHERGGRVFDLAAVDAAEQELFESVAKLLASKPLAASVRRAALRTTRTLPPAMLAAVLDRLQQQGRVRAAAHGNLLFLDRMRPLAPADQAELDRVVDRVDELAFRPPTRDELAAQLAIPAARLEGLLSRAIDEGRVEPIGEHYWSALALQKALVAIRRNCLQHDGVLDIPGLRDSFETSRKFLIPLLEHVDQLGLTVLRGGVRRLLPNSPVAQGLAGIEG